MACDGSCPLPRIRQTSGRIQTRRFRGLTHATGQEHTIRVSIHISRLRHPLLEIDRFTTAPRQSWCIFGANDSGIETFFAVLAGEVVPSAKKLLLPEHPGILSFKLQQEVYEEELRRDDSDYLDYPDPGTPARAFLPADSGQSPLVEALDMAGSLDKGYRQLSSGQSRKLFLLRAILRGSRHLVIQNPYDGLDQPGCAELDKALAVLASRGIEIIVAVSIQDDIPPWCSHLAVLHHGRMTLQGPRTEIIGQIGGIQAPQDDSLPPDPVLQATAARVSAAGEEELVNLRNGSATFGEQQVFMGLDLLITSGRHTLITGPNGSGKSTLLQIVTGDNANCYANDLRIFGRRRGSGESIWDVKRRMGIVSSDLHRNYRAPGTTRQVVLSGLFDSIGLYRQATTSQEQLAGQWLQWLNLDAKASLPFRRLSFADQRLVLIARALIKFPPLLILDEPTQGLDDLNRGKLLDFLDWIARNRISTMLYVSHRSDEFRSFFRQHIQLHHYHPAAGVPPCHRDPPDRQPPGKRHLFQGDTP